MPAKCHNCGEPLEPNMDKCPKCGSGDRDIVVEDKGRGQDIVTVTRSLAAGYNQLSGSFTVDQKRIADSVGIPSNLEILEGIAQSDKRLVQIAEQQIEDARKQRKWLYIPTVIAIIAIIVAVIVWIFPRA